MVLVQAPCHLMTADGWSSKFVPPILSVTFSFTYCRCARCRIWKIVTCSSGTCHSAKRVTFTHARMGVGSGPPCIPPSPTHYVDTNATQGKAGTTLRCPRTALVFARALQHLLRCNHKVVWICGQCAPACSQPALLSLVVLVRVLDAFRDAHYMFSLISSDELAGSETT